MCGIVGYIGDKNPKNILLDGLKRLEYRGYDSAGIAIFDQGKIKIVRSVGKLVELEKKLNGVEFKGGIGIGHTRWATHGGPTELNAHPHQSGSIVLVHNGIIENYNSLKEELVAQGVKFVSETDTEIAAHLINGFLEKGKGWEEAVIAAMARLRGSFALGIINENEPDKLIAVKNGTPLIVGLGKGENFIASDIPALLKYTKQIIQLNDGEIAICTSQRVVVKNSQGREISKPVKEIKWTEEMIEKRGYPHFMLKEIHEQPLALIHTFQERILPEKKRIVFEKRLFKFSDKELREIKKIFLVACGTAYHASLVGRYLLEGIARIPCQIDLASEFRYREPIIDKDCLLIITSQSGETADSLAALREGKRLGARTLAICNVRDSSIPREAEGVIYTFAGPEIGVASTKAFTTQILIFNLLALYLARLRGEMSDFQLAQNISEIIRLPIHLQTILDKAQAMKEIAEKYYKKKAFLYLGRGINCPIALEGALKLKEISYINADGYAAGEMKHGPIALIDEEMPIIVIAPRDKNYEKIVSNIEEARARGGIIIAIGSEGDEDLKRLANDVFFVPQVSWPFLPLILALPIQLLAYYVAVRKGTDVDQPRNLAKSVTVE